MNTPAFFVNYSGTFIRYIELEAMQTFYNMTKEPNSKNRTLNTSEVHSLITLTPDDLTFEKLVSLLAHKGDQGKAMYEPEDKMTIPAGSYCGNKEPINTTVGRFLFNKIIVEGCNLYNTIGYINKEVTEGVLLKEIDQAVANAGIENKIPVDSMYKYVDTRDWLGLQLHPLITPSFTPATTQIHPEVKKLRDELFKKYAKELKDGDAATAEKIEKELIAKTKELLKDDIGMDLYNSGARGSLKNNYKNIALMRGAVFNRATGKYEIVKNALNDGLDKKDIPVSANTILEGAYP